LTSQEILDKAFKKASKVSSDDPKLFFRVEKVSRAKIDSISSVIPQLLRKWVKTYPSVDNLPVFYLELIDLTIGKDKMKKSLGALDSTANKVQRLCSQYNHKIYRSRDVGEMNSLLKAAYGRVSSMVMKLEPDLKFLNEARRTINRFPSIDPDRPMIVIAGLPNVGKSLLVTALTSGKPKVASYPFTTKHVSIGHFMHKRMKYQVMDTPGLLDREKKNEFERQAVLALRHVSNMILVVLDLNGHCGYTPEEQLAFFEQIKREYDEIPVIPVENKVDLGTEYSDQPAYKEFLEKNDIKEPTRVSAITKDNIETLRERVLAALEEPTPERNRF